MNRRSAKTTWILALALLCVPLLLVAADMVHAQGYIGTGWDQFIRGNVPNVASGGRSGELLVELFIRNGIRIIKYLVGGIALLFGILYAINFILAQGAEEEISKFRKSFLWLFLGFMILMVADSFASILNPMNAQVNQLIDFHATHDELRNIANYLKWLFGSIVMLLLMISAWRMIKAEGDEEILTLQKTHMAYSIIGMLVILLADNIVNAVYTIKASGDVAPGSTTTALGEITGIIRLILVFMGPVAILFTIAAGFMYLTAFGDDEKLGKAKNMIIGGVTGIIIVYAAYAIVNTFTTAPKLLPPEPPPAATP